MAQAAGGEVGVRSISALETAEPTVGSHVLEAIGRFLGRYLTGWDEGTPQAILDGREPPPLATATAAEPPPIQGSTSVVTARQRQLLEAVVENLQDDLSPEEMLGMFAEIIAEIRRKKATHGDDVDAAG